MSTVPGDTAENTLSFLSLNPAPVPEVDERLGEELLEAAAGERPQRADAEVVALLLLQQRPERPVGSGGDADLDLDVAVPSSVDPVVQRGEAGRAGRVDHGARAGRVRHRGHDDLLPRIERGQLAGGLVDQSQGRGQRGDEVTSVSDDRQ
jgi:hypothetical protein